MLFAKLSEYFQKIEQTSSRNEKMVLLASILKEAEQDEVSELIYLALGGLRPEFDRLEFNLAEKGIVRALNVPWEEYQRIGDLGFVAERLGNRKQELEIRELYAELEKIARESGVGSQERKVVGLAKLLGVVGGIGAKYIVRIVAGKLRLGFSDKTVIDAISYMEAGSKEYSELLEQAYQRRPDVGVLGAMCKQLGVVKATYKIDVAIGTPIVPALAQRLKTADEMIKKMGRVYVEPKYDGTRVQIHFSRVITNNQALISKQIQNSNNQTGLFGEENPKYWVKTFTRNLDENSWMFPELAKIGEQIVADEVILDCEAVGYDPKTLKLVPFQLTITRKRKHGVEAAQSTVPLRFFVFDIMYLNGRSLINLPLTERKKILSETIRGNEVMVVDPYIETDDPNTLREYHKKQLGEGLEGVLVKQAGGVYAPGRVGFNWVKFKETEDSAAKLADTIDAVIMGYYRGKGKRSKFELGAFLVGIRGKHQAPNSNNQNINEDTIVTIAKVGTGISDAQFGQLGERLHELETNNPDERYVVSKILEPDVWVEPRMVVEVAADEITMSPTHTAGYALRFPRLIRIREDKGLEQITTRAELESMI